MKTKFLGGMTVAASLIGLVLSSVPALSANPTEMGRWKDWSAYSLQQDDGQKVCFIVSEPVEKLPKNVNHGSVFFLVTNWIDRDIAGEPSIMTGYEFKPGSAVTAEVGGDKWEMFTEQQGAWIRNRKDEKNLLEAMKKGSDLRVKGTSTRGTATEYKISLLGISAALQKINEGCS